MGWHNHTICDECWESREGDRTPIRLTNAPRVNCCFCGRPQTSGILVRARIDDGKTWCGWVPEKAG